MSDAKNIFEAAINPLAYLQGAAVSGTKKAMTPPGMPAPRVAPTPDSATLQSAAARAYQRKYASLGRASTLLSNQDTLG